MDSVWYITLTDLGSAWQGRWEDSPEVAALKEDPTKPVSFSLLWGLEAALLTQELREVPFWERWLYLNSLLAFSQAKLHGNEPSKGAKIDAQIQQEEEEELKRKGKA